MVRASAAPPKRTSSAPRATVLGIVLSEPKGANEFIVRIALLVNPYKPAEQRHMHTPSVGPAVNYLSFRYKPARPQLSPHTLLLNNCNLKATEMLPAGLSSHTIHYSMCWAYFLPWELTGIRAPNKARGGVPVRSTTPAPWALLRTG